MEVTIVQALLIGLVYYLGANGTPWLTVNMGWALRRPLISGIMVGLILGDPVKGCIVGAAINVTYLAQITAGGAQTMDEGLAGTVGTDPQGRRGAAEDRPDQLQLATGGHSFQLCGKCRHPGAGGRHGRRQRRRTVRHRGIKVWDDVRIKNSPTSMRTPGITH